MNIQPTNDLLLIRRIVNDAPRTASGILLPPVEESADTPFSGVVLAAGPGKHAKLSPAGENVTAALQSLVDAFHAMPNINWGARGFSMEIWQKAVDALNEQKKCQPRMAMQVKVGDKVVFSRNGFQEYKIDGETLIGLGEASIMGIID
jgi:co-chaperonin GroES (HSP10)